jgi:hypothetical protein
MGTEGNANTTTVGQDEAEEEAAAAAPAPVAPLASKTLQPEPPVVVPTARNVHFSRIATCLTDGAAATTDVVAACDDVRSIDTRSEAAIAQVQEHGILDAVCRLLQRVPSAPLKLGGKGDAAGNEEAEEDGVTPSVLRELEQAREKLRDARERFDEIVLPATRAVAHLCGGGGALRRHVADAIVSMRALWSLLMPLSSPSVQEAALRALASISHGSATLNLIPWALNLTPFTLSLLP